MSGLSHVNVPFEVKAVNDDGTFEGYGAVFGNVDLGRDRIHKGAFAPSLKLVDEGKRRIKMLWQHDPHNPIGVYPTLKEDDHGLFVKGKIVLEVQQGKEAHALMKAGALDGLSIGFRTKRYDIDKDEMVRNLYELDLHEVSPVTFPMNTDARLTSVKSVRDFEQWLTRDAGFTRSEALTIINEGYKSFARKRDAVDEGLADLIKRNISILGG